MPDYPNTYRCSRCDHNWQRAQQYRVCPVCKQETWDATVDRVMTNAECKEILDGLKQREENLKAFEEWEVGQAMARFDEELGSLLC